MEDPVFNVVIECFLTDAQLRVDLQDLIGGKALFEKGCDGIRHFSCLFTGKVHAKPGIRKSKPVILVSCFRGISIFVKPAV